MGQQRDQNPSRKLPPHQHRACRILLPAGFVQAALGWGQGRQRMVTAGLELQLLHIRHFANKTLHSGWRFCPGFAACFLEEALCHLHRDALIAICRTLGNTAPLPRLLQPEIIKTERVDFFFFFTEQHTRLIFTFLHAMKLVQGQGTGFGIYFTVNLPDPDSQASKIGIGIEPHSCRGAEDHAIHPASKFHCIYHGFKPCA